MGTLSLRKNDMLNRRIAMEIVRERFGAEALRALEDLERASAKEAKEEKADVKLTSKGLAPRRQVAATRIVNVSTKVWDAGHMIFDCPAKKKS